MAKAKRITKKEKVVAEIGAGLLAAGAAAAAAGYYFYGSAKAKQHRKIVTKWATDMKKEVIREAKRLKKMDSREFAKVVDTVSNAYRGAKSVNAADLKRAANELKSNWKMVQKELGKTGAKSVSRAKTVGKKALSSGKKTVKKIVKKASPKKATRKSR